MQISILALLVFFACTCGDDKHKKVSAQKLSNNTSTMDVSTIEDEVEQKSE